jgi:gamma-glutamyltranspeptidase/glutathione hydrolase
VGHLLRNPELAQTLRRVARDGADAFYRGEIAHDIVAAVAGHANAGDLTESDLAGYHAKVRRPVCGTYRVYRVCSMPPPSSGGIAVLQILGLLERFDMAALAPQSALAVHFFTEAGRLAFADRNRYIADPDYVGVPAQLTDPAYLHRRSLLIRNDASLGRAQPGDPEPSRKAAQRADDMAPELPSTSHLSVVDRYGNALSMTTTIENGFGSRIMTHGVLLNNELTDFSFLPSANGIPVANRVEGGKRPRSSMAPVIVYDQKGRVLLVVGSVGGPFIINHVVKTLIGVLDWGLDPQAAIDLPNMGSLNGPTLLERDTALAPLQPRLEALGHEVRMLELNSGVQAILRTNDGWVGGADPRREGTALGD